MDDLKYRQDKMEEEMNVRFLEINRCIDDIKQEMNIRFLEANKPFMTPSKR